MLAYTHSQTQHAFSIYQAGVEKVLNLLNAELKGVMGLLGATKLTDLSPALVMKRPADVLTRCDELFGYGGGSSDTYTRAKL
jgi:hypothetical protein